LLKKIQRATYPCKKHSLKTKIDYNSFERKKKKYEKNESIRSSCLLACGRECCNGTNENWLYQR
jgi:hypothetical protein